MEEQFNNPLVNYAAYQVAFKEVINFLKRSFPKLETTGLEDAASIAFVTTNKRYEANALTIPFMSYCKMVAWRRAADEVSRLSNFNGWISIFVHEPIIDRYEEMDDDDLFILEKIKAYKIKNHERARLFKADLDEAFEHFNDEEKAIELNFLATTALATRQKRFRTKREIIRSIEGTPQYQRLRVIYNRRQAA